MARQTGPGRIHVYRVAGLIQAALYNFDIDGDELKAEHRRWLDAHVVPRLRSGGRVALLAQTSRTASPEHNLQLSQRRAHAAAEYIGLALSPRVSIFESRAVGEARAQAQGQQDDVENEWYRSVLVLASPGPAPAPPPPPPPRPRFQLPCGYYDFWIAWETGLAQAWALSLGRPAAPGPGPVWEEAPEGGSGSFGMQYLFYGKPDREHFLMAMGAAMSRYYPQGGIDTGRLLRLYEWYRGEVMPNGGYDFINHSAARLRALREERQRTGCTGARFEPPPGSSRSAPTVPPAPPPPQRDRRGRLY